MVDDLTEFLRARLDEDAALAEAASPGPWHTNEEAEEVLAVDGITVADGFALSGRQLRATTEHIACQDPTRVLREIEVKRELLKEHTVDGWTCSTCAMPEDFDEDADGNREWSRRGQDFPCRTLRLAASVYADRPGYREDWRP
ncbi:DUF6221 family protein [Streptomyces sp. NPDC058398]|uniref:DUF6221 family protein n=1 Tax=Streptomyces sp. NPDC058398 TaxID=3346479 RepID=UPI003653B88A